MIDPHDVTAPQTRWTLTRVLIRERDWSLALGIWDKKPALACRWNGSESETAKGNPISTGHPTWFIVPRELFSREWMTRMTDEEVRALLVATFPDPFARD